MNEQQQPDLDDLGEAQTIETQQQMSRRPRGVAKFDAVGVTVSDLNAQIAELLANNEAREEENEVMAARMKNNAKLTKQAEREIAKLREKRDIVGIAAMRIALRDQP